MDKRKSTGRSPGLLVETLIVGFWFWLILLTKNWPTHE